MSVPSVIEKAKSLRFAREECQVETEFTMNTPGQANGILRLWVNGTLYIEKLNLQMRGPTPTTISSQGLATYSTRQFYRAQVFVQSGGGNMWWDRIAVGNTRINLVGQTPSGDIIAPTAPTLNSVTNGTLSWTKT